MASLAGATGGVLGPCFGVCCEELFLLPGNNERPLMVMLRLFCLYEENSFSIMTWMTVVSNFSLFSSEVIVRLRLLALDGIVRRLLH